MSSVTAAASAASPTDWLRQRAPTSRVRAYLGDNPWEQLHAAPTFWVIAATMAFSSISTYILDQHILSTKDQVAVFVIGSYVVFSSYYVIYHFLDRFSTSFKAISDDKKMYTISNLLKAGILMSITPFAVTELYGIVVHDRWNTNVLRNLGCIYAVPDFVSMLVVRRMAWSTIFHHVCVQVFNFFSVMNDYSQSNVCRLIVVYAAFSTFAYCVNMLLGSRFLGVSAMASRCLSAAAFIVYTACCAVNWSWQAFYLRRMFAADPADWTLYVYVSLIGFIVYDDIVLNKWLLLNMRRAEGMVTPSAEDEQRKQRETESAAAAVRSASPRGVADGWKTSLRLRVGRLMFSQK